MVISSRLQRGAKGMVMEWTGWVGIWALPLIGWVTLDESLNLSEPPFLYKTEMTAEYVDRG